METSVCLYPALQGSLVRKSAFPSQSWHCLQVEVLEDQSTGKRTIRTTSMCWGNKLSLLARPALFDPRLQADPQRPGLDFSQAVLEISDDEAWQKVRPPPAAGTGAACVSDRVCCLHVNRPQTFAALQQAC